jgi:peptide/nickel transport system permease protein
MAEAERTMTPSNPADTAAVLQRLRTGVGAKPRTLWGDAWRRFRRHKLAIAGTIILIFFIVAVIVGPSIYTAVRIAEAERDGITLSRSDREFRAMMDMLDFESVQAPPSLKHPFGTDELGRDILARALFGGRISLLVGFVAMLIAVTLGSVIGAVAGFFGGKIDQVLMRLTDLFLSLPVLPLLLLTIYLFREHPVILSLGRENGTFVIVVTMIGGLAWMSTARIVRAAFLSLKEKEFVEAATALGVRRSAIMFRHILPNAFSPIIVAATLGVGSSIIAESTLSFLGVGFSTDTPTWGRLVTDGNNYLQIAPHMALVPGALIFLTVLSINFMGDGLRDALDPRSRL